MKKIISLLVTLSVFFCVSVTTAFAATSTQDGIEVKFDTDKTEYSSDENIVTTLTVTNTNEEAVTNVSLEDIIPDGYKVADSSSQKTEVPSLEPGTTATLTVTLTPESSNKTSDPTVSQDSTQSDVSTGDVSDVSGSGNVSGSSDVTPPGNTDDVGPAPTTGDSTNVLIYLAVLAAAIGGIVVAVKLGKKRRGSVLSILICAAVVGAPLFGMIPETSAEALTPTVDAEYSTIKVSQTVKVGNENVELNAVVKYTPVQAPAFTVTFETNGGSEIAPQKVSPGTPAVQPGDPVKEGFTFAGWYQEATLENVFDFSTAINSDVTLYAKWEQTESGSEQLTGSGSFVDVYSISNLKIDTETLTASATVSAPENCALVVRFIEEDIYFSDDYPNNKEYINDGSLYASHVVPAGCDMQDVFATINGTLPENFVAEAVLLDSEGNPLCDPYSNIDNTQRHRDFDALTVNDFADANLVLNFDSNESDNFGVLADDVKILSADKITVPDYDINSEEYKVYLIENPSADISVGDKIFIGDSDCDYLFKVREIAEENGVLKVTSEKANDETNGYNLNDFYKFLKVDMTYTSDAQQEEPTPEESVPESSSEPVAANYVRNNSEYGIMPLGLNVAQAKFNPPGIQTGITFNPATIDTGNCEVSYELSGTITAELDLEWDVVLFGADYFKCDFVYTLETEQKGTVNLKIEPDEDTVEADQKELKLGKICIPFGVTGLDAFGEFTLDVDWKVSGGLEITGNTETKNGFLFNTKDGSQKIDQKDSTWTLDTKAHAEITIGPKTEVGIEFLGGAVSGGLEAQFGGKAEGDLITSSVSGNENIEKIHACQACVDGEVKVFFTVNAKLEYDVLEILKGTPIDFNILNVEHPLFDFYVSILNSPDSMFGGHPRFGTGDCPNMEYKITFKAVDAEGNAVDTNIAVTNNTTGQSKGSVANGNSLFLAPATYTASATIDGSECSKEFTVTENPKTVTLTATDIYSRVTGSVSDAVSRQPIQNASVRIYKNDELLSSTTSLSNGSFSFTLEEGTYKVVASADNYSSSSQIISVGRNDDKVLETIMLVPLDEDEIMGGIYGRIEDAATGDPVEGVNVVISQGWASDDTTPIKVAETVTDENGRYMIQKTTVFDVNFGLETGSYTLSVSKEGYIPNSFSISIVGGEDSEFDSTITPIGSEEEYRIVLTWGVDPRDLDTHFNGTIDGSNDHIFYLDMHGEGASLDVDDTTSYGPETLTIPDIRKYSGNVTYSVHDYTNRYESSSTELSASSAKVDVYKGSELLKTFYVPFGREGTVWNVFYITPDEQIVPINTFEYESDPHQVGRGS